MVLKLDDLTSPHLCIHRSYLYHLNDYFTIFVRDPKYASDDPKAEIIRSELVTLK